jgi:predicted ATP-grasp superfamily ATP-dependent carboligase
MERGLWCLWEECRSAFSKGSEDVSVSRLGRTREEDRRRADDEKLMYDQTELDREGEMVSGQKEEEKGEKEEKTMILRPLVGGGAHEKVRSLSHTHALTFTL